MNTLRRTSIVLVAGLGIALGWNVILIPGPAPVDPVVRFALDSGGPSYLTRFNSARLTANQKCVSLFNLYVQAGALGDHSTYVSQRMLAKRSRDELGIDYIAANCSIGALLVLNAILHEQEQKLIKKTYGDKTPAQGL